MEAYNFSKILLNVKRLTLAKIVRKSEIIRRHYLNQDAMGKSDKTLCLFTPVVESDLVFLERGIEFYKRYLLHDVSRHYVIGANSELIKDFCHKHSCTFVDEQDILPNVREQIKRHYPESLAHRTGWLFQQLLKLNCDSVCDQDEILVLDSDTIFVTPSRFHWDGKWLLDYNSEFHSGYDAFAAKLLGWNKIHQMSFICHYMLMERGKLSALRKLIEETTDMSWVGGILSNLDYGEPRNFSEYQLYANFVLNRYPEDYRVGYWFHSLKQLPDVNRDSIIRYCEDQYNIYKTCSFVKQRVNR